MKISRLIFIPLLLIFISFSLIAQEDVLRPNGKPGVDYSKFEKSSFILGVRTGMNYNMFSQDMAYVDYILPNTPYKVFESGGGLSLYLGFLADVSLNEEWGLQFAVDFDNVYFANEDDGLVECTDIDGWLITNAAKAEMEYNYSGLMFDFSILARYNINKNFSILFGPIIRMPIGDFENEFTLTSKEDGCYADVINQRKSVTYESDVEFDSQLGVDFGMLYKIPLSKKMWLVPELHFNYFLNKTNEDILVYDYDRSQQITYGEAADVQFSDAFLHSLKLGVAIWFEI